jgi:hypothetical protein
LRVLGTLTTNVYSVETCFIGEKDLIIAFHSVMNNVLRSNYQFNCQSNIVKDSPIWESMFNVSVLIFFAMNFTLETRLDFSAEEQRMCAPTFLVLT